MTLAHFGHDWCWRRDQIKRAKILPDLDQMREREREQTLVLLSRVSILKTFPVALQSTSDQL